MKILVFGASGMIGSAMYRVLSAKAPHGNDDLQVWARYAQMMRRNFSLKTCAARLSLVSMWKSRMRWCGCFPGYSQTWSSIALA